MAEVKSKDKHRVERVVDALMERFERDVQNLVNAHTVHGRPIFMVPVSPQEQLERYLTPEVRQTIAGQMDDEQAMAYYTKMAKLAQERGDQ